MQAIIDLPQPQLLEIQQIAQAEATTESFLLQKIISEWLMQKKAEAPHPLRASFGLWKDNPEIIDGVEYQNRLRAEWD